MAATILMSLYYTAFPQRKACSDVWLCGLFWALDVSFCFSFINSLHALSHDSCLGGRRSLLCLWLWWGAVYCKFTVFCSVSDFSEPNNVHATEVAARWGMSSSICFDWLLCGAVATVANRHQKQWKMLQWTVWYWDHLTQNVNGGWNVC